MRLKTGRSLWLLVWLQSVVLGALPLPAARAQPTIPPVWDVVAESFESGNLDAWGQISAEDLRLVPAAGRHRSTALGVNVGPHESFIYRADVARAEEGYLTFWFNPNGVSIPDEGTSWVPGKSLCLTSVLHRDDWWPPLVALNVWRPAGQGYQAYLAWPIDEQDNRHFDYELGSFDLVDGWQQLTVGYRINGWVAVWRNGELMRYATDVVHTDPYGDIVELGKTSSSSNSPSGVMLFDEFSFQIPRVDDLWVDAENGGDEHDGLTPATAFRTIQRAADLAGPGTTVHIQPGVYRETVWPGMDGGATEPALYRAEDGPGTAVIRGSEASSSLAWTQLAANTIGLPPGVDPTDIWYADLSSWELEGAPRFVVELDGGGGVAARLPLAREPDWEVTTDWKVHQFWWAADGGWSAAGCDPATDPDPNCDYGWRSLDQLTDRTDDVGPPGIEPGNLTTLGNLTGATLRAIDTKQGHYVYRRTIVAHNIAAGRVTVDRICEHDGGSGDPGLGWGSKYYVEGLPYLLDTPGEWWYDAGSARLYLWPPAPGDPAAQQIEISRRDHGFELSQRSYITLDGLTLEFFNGSAVYQSNWYENGSCQNTVRAVTARYANVGLWVEQSVRADSPPGNITDGFTLESSEIGYMDTYAIRLTDWWEDDADPDAFTHSGVVNTLIRGNELHHLGFRTDRDNAVGAVLQFANKLRFEGNHVHHVAHNGVQIIKSVIQSHKLYGFDPDEIKTGEILVRDNLFERACQLTTDCGALKIWGSPPDTHVFRDLLVTGNVFRDTFGWTYVSEARGRWAGGDGSDVRGLGGFGLYVDMASGVHAYRNVAYNNACTGYMFSGVWRDGDMVYYNNVAANSLFGFYLGGSGFDTHGGSVNTQLIDNIVVNNEGYGILQTENDGVYGNLVVDHNLYFNNGWRSWEDGGLWKPGAMTIYRADGGDEYYQTLAEIQAGTPWEDHGQAGDPHFWDYDLDDHDLHDGSWPDFHPTAASDRLIDQGAVTLPGSLAALLHAFGVADPRRGAAYDIGRYEAGFSLLASPPSQVIEPGGTARYALRLYPPDLAFDVALVYANPSPSLSLSLDPAVISGDAIATLTILDSHAGSTPLSGVRYTVPVTGTGGGFVQPISVGFLVGGMSIYLPVICRD